MKPAPRAEDGVFVHADRGLGPGSDKRSGYPSGGPPPPRASRRFDALVTATGNALGGGVESGVPGSAVPSEPPPWTAPDQGWEPLAARLRELVAARLPAWADRVAVEVSSADVVEGARRRRVAFARVLLGPNPRLPLWSRALLLPDPAGADADAGTRADTGIEPAWLAPLVREVEAWALPWRGAAPRAGQEAVLDAFAAADLLRAAAAAWLHPGARAGRRVLARGFDLDDPGSPFAGGVDDEGTPERPLAAVRDGLLVMRPRGLADEQAGRGRSTGSAVSSSWRSAPAPGWRSLVLTAPRAAALPPRAPVVTRVVLLPGAAGTTGAGGTAVLFGHVPDEGRFGPWPAGAPADLLAAAYASCGPAVADAVGVPVTVPPLLLTGPGWRAPDAS